MPQAAVTPTPGPAIDPAANPPADPAVNPPSDPANPPADPAANPPSDPATPPADPAANPPADPPANPQDWAARRVELAKGDEKLLKRLERYSSEEAVVDALIAAQNKISSGALKTALPKDATPEQITEWRAENGLPTKVDEYEVKLPDGMVIGDDDKPYIDKFLEQALESNMSPEQVNKALGWYFQDRENQMAELRAADEAAARDAAEAMRKEWGSEYKLNFNLIDNMLKQAPEGVAELIKGARLPNGAPLGSDPQVLRWLANTARELNPTSTIVPKGGSDAMQTIEAELASITKLMGDHKSEYWKGPTSEKLQARYRELITVKEKFK